MEQLNALLERYSTAITVIWVVLVVLGAFLFWRGRTGNTTQLNAKSGGVVVGGDNNGSISTGASSGGDSPRAAASKPHEIIGAIVALLGVILAALQWLYPRP